MSGGWHVTDPHWAAYRAGALDTVEEASIEAHLVGCAVCREAAAAYVARPPLDALWQSVVADVRKPVLPMSLRWLRRLGVSQEDVVLLAAGGGFAIPWAVAVGSALLTVFVAAMMPIRAEATFLFAAPLIPVAAVAAALDATDPLRTLTVSTPYSKVRLVLLRTVATLVVTLPATMTIGLGLPGLRPIAYSWLLPGLFLTSAALLLMTWLPPWTATALTALGWAAVVLGAATREHLGVVSTATSQVAFLCAAVALAATFVTRTTSFRLLGGAG